MRIKHIKRQHRRDFTAVYICEHCDHEFEGGGYDDSYFHNQVIPSWACPSCGEKASQDYRPLQTKYPDSQTV